MLTGPDGRAAPLVSLFAPERESAPGQARRLIHWREL
jgi:hypothetical protein